MVYKLAVILIIAAIFVACNDEEDLVARQRPLSDEEITNLLNPEMREKIHNNTYTGFYRWEYSKYYQYPENIEESILHAFVKRGQDPVIHGGKMVSLFESYGGYLYINNGNMYCTPGATPKKWMKLALEYLCGSERKVIDYMENRYMLCINDYNYNIHTSIFEGIKIDIAPPSKYNKKLAAINEDGICIQFNNLFGAKNYHYSIEYYYNKYDQSKLSDLTIAYSWDELASIIDKDIREMAGDDYDKMVEELRAVAGD